ncbi:uncharacterized protein EV154DRAFT_592689 [Mucor mucedo]|uniref:uncharacterized protein n=1 Tax=Mucor mucedo TaxID=29922 RepID=UPI00222015F4|nr:uncharacterized protein EV154DRAFT_592689 [Mucor mucedo]KAI7889116.1 hypothetical protein EV154DRAFT_592689 [Mucor mucedo]
MEKDIIDKFLRKLTVYTVEKNIANFNNSTGETSVICLEDFKNHLKQTAPIVYNVMKSHYATLSDFLMSEEALESSQKQSYEIMTVGEYQQDLRHLNNTSLNLETFPTDDTQLLVMYVKNATMSPEKSLTEEIIACYKENYLLKEDVYRVKRSIRDKVNAAVQSIFPQLNVSVQMIRSSHTELAFPDGTINMGIVVPGCSIKDKGGFFRFQKRYNCLKNMDNFSKCFEKIGMIDLKYCPQRGDVFIFTDSMSGNLCKLSVDSGLMYEREKLIGAYLELDKRIRPLITVILHFSRSHGLKKAEGNPFLSTYSHIVLVLNFLMNGLNYPVIPSLQNLSQKQECNFEDCLYTKNKGVVVTRSFRKTIKELSILYHTCVLIEHSGDDYLKISTENRTVWKSYNNDSLGTLLIAFFKYYANPKNLTGGISIFYAGKRRFPDFSTPIVIQDPFLPSNNISCVCESFAKELIIQKFDAAWKALEAGESLQFICGSNLDSY